MNKTESGFLFSSVLVAFSMYLENQHDLCDMILVYAFEKVCNRPAPLVQNIKQHLTPNKPFAHRFNEFQLACGLDAVDVIVVNWNVTIAPSLWHWIHIVSIYMNHNAGQLEKNSFVKVIELLILCNFCKNHYRQKISYIFKWSLYYSLSDVFLILHTIINSNMFPTEFKNEDLIKHIQHEYRKNYIEEYETLVKSEKHK